MASGDTLISWRALDAEPPIDDFATFETFLAIQVGQNDPLFPGLVYADAVNRFAYFGATMPANYDGGGIHVEIEESRMIELRRTSTGDDTGFPFDYSRGPRLRRHLAQFPDTELVN